MQQGIQIVRSEPVKPLPVKEIQVIPENSGTRVQGRKVMALYFGNLNGSWVSIGHTANNNGGDNAIYVKPAEIKVLANALLDMVAEMEQT